MDACMNAVCVLYFTVYVYMYVLTAFKLYVWVPLYSTKGIVDVVLNKKTKFVFLKVNGPTIIRQTFKK